MAMEEIKCNLIKLVFSIYRNIHSLDFYLKLHTCKGAYDIFMTGTSRDSHRQVFIYLQKLSFTIFLGILLISSVSFYFFCFWCLRRNFV